MMQVKPDPAWMKKPHSGFVGFSPPKLLRSLPMARQCVYLGERLTLNEVKEKQLVGCRTCNNKVPAFHCKLPGAKKFNDGPYTREADCMNCEDWKGRDYSTRGIDKLNKFYSSIGYHENPATTTEVSRRTTRFDQYTLSPGVQGLRFNTSIAKWKDGYVMAFRTGWGGSEIYCQQMTNDFQHIGSPVFLKLRHHDANYGREDPQLFWYGGALHVAFVGVQGYGRRTVKTNVLFARLSMSLQVEDVFNPKPPGISSKVWQKNWGWFQHGDDLYAIYSIAPHKILRVWGNQCEWAYETPTPALWSGGHLRGGASPVLVGDEYYCFFHGKHESPLNYNIGVYTFEAKPPFRILRCTPHPIEHARTNDVPHGQYCPVVFPRGAVLVT